MKLVLVFLLPVPFLLIVLQNLYMYMADLLFSLPYSLLCVPSNLREASPYHHVFSGSATSKANIPDMSALETPTALSQDGLQQNLRTHRRPTLSPHLLRVGIGVFWRLRGYGVCY